jgi:hypothetical protein
MKNRLLDLLPPFVDVDEEKVFSSVKKISGLNFPLTSKELVVGSSAYSDYVQGPML